VGRTLDFFISYTSTDEPWAGWIGYVLEEEGLSVILQAWDFRPGSNFVLEMQKAASEAQRTIMVLSPNYMKSQFAAPEWAAAFSGDPQGLGRSLVPVVVEDCHVTGLLNALVHINLVGADEEEARRRLIDGISLDRAKPSSRPTFPGPSNLRPHRAFPGTPQVQTSNPAVYVPKLRRALSDIDKRRFFKQSFEAIRGYFQTALEQLAQRASGVEFELHPNAATEFAVEVFADGKSVCACHIWLGGMHSSDGISYAEGRNHYERNRFNEILSLREINGDLFLSSLMGIGIGFGQNEGTIDLKQMTPAQAAEYLWRRFVAPLER
jgi:hypothetical protein